MTTSPAELLEQSLGASGDTLYRMALLACGDERAAESLLRQLSGDLVAAWREAPPATPPDELFLLTQLVAAARNLEAKSAAAQRPPPASARRPSLSFGPFAIQHLTLNQRLALGLHLLLGFDAIQLARALGVDEAAARGALTEAVRTLGPAAGHALTDRVSSEHCHAVREALADPLARARKASAVRGHLATCSHCRAFDYAWGEIVQAVDGALRESLRARTLPAPLASKLLAAARPSRRRLDPSLRLALPPLAVLALIAALVIPGFLRTPVSVVERDQSAAVDPQQLLSEALTRHSTPPHENGVWYGRFQTQWFFDANTFAPLTAEMWLDARIPSRHRLQITHADGGAPYEMQLGNGHGELYYALDSTYAPALYGGLNTRARPEQPALLTQRMDADQQLRARDERLATGPWGIAPAYLRQAQEAPDLRVLGRQRDGSRTVQILSFSGISPLGLPIDAPGATAERVTVLLALDIEDGLLRSASELAGPAGAEQTSRVTWRLTEERWLVSNDQIASAFAADRAWTGVGDFSEIGRQESADSALPMIPASAVGDPAQLLAAGRSFWMPSAPPAGVDRALLLWGEREQRSGAPPEGLVYLGPGRRLVMVFNMFRQLPGESLNLGPWRATFQASRSQRYKLFLSRPRDGQLQGSSGVDPSANVLIDAYGFSRDELVDLVNGMRPFDVAALAAQDALFSRAEATSQEARNALLGLALDSVSTPTNQARHTLAQQFIRQEPAAPDPRADPYHLAAYEGHPSTTAVEEWASNMAGPARYVEIRAASGAPVLSSAHLAANDMWRHLEFANATQLLGQRGPPLVYRLPYPAGLALALLGADDAQLALERLPGGEALVTATQPADASLVVADSLGAGVSQAAYAADLNLTFVVSEIRLDASGAATAVEHFAVDQNGARTLLASYTVEQRELVRLASAPPSLLGGTPPAADFTTIGMFIGEPGDAVNASAQIQTLTITEAAVLASAPLFTIEEPGAATLTLVEQGHVAPDFRGPTTGDALSSAVALGLATRLTYQVATGPDSQPAFLQIVQGPAAPLRSFLRTRSDVPWAASAPVQVSVAGRTTDAWLGQGELSYLIVELDDTLLIVAATPALLDNEAPAILDRLLATERL